MNEHFLVKLLRLKGSKYGIFSRKRHQNDIFLLRFCYSDHLEILTQALGHEKKLFWKVWRGNPH